MDDVTSQHFQIPKFPELASISAETTLLNTSYS